MAHARSMVFASVLALAGAWALDAQEPDTLRSDQEGVLLRGRIVDLTTQRPIPNVSVRLLDLDADAWPGAA